MSGMNILKTFSFIFFKPKTYPMHPGSLFFLVITAISPDLFPFFETVNLVLQHKSMHPVIIFGEKQYIKKVRQNTMNLRNKNNLERKKQTNVPPKKVGPWTTANWFSLPAMSRAIILTVGVQPPAPMGTTAWAKALGRAFFNTPGVPSSNFQWGIVKQQILKSSGVVLMSPLCNQACDWQQAQHTKQLVGPIWAKLSQLPLFSKVITVSPTVV